MPDKLTDKEIVKALECCNKNDCRTCPYGKYNVTGWCCMPKVRKDAIDLINRLQAENEELHKKYDDTVLLDGNIVQQVHELLITAKAEAYKEFADRLKEKAFIILHHKMILSSDIDNLLKELVGDNND